VSKVHDDILTELRIAPRTLRSLTSVLVKIYGHWYNDATISARIRDLRKDKYGKHNVVRTKRGKMHLYHIPKETE
jgi:hypothetical protein